jgi:uncharacterized membrane protein
VDFVVSNPHGRPSPPETATGKLFIKFWSVPTSTNTQKTKIDVAFGIALVDGQNDAFKPTEEGTPVIDPVTEQVVGEVHGGTLYVLFDLPHAGKAGELMSGIMQCYMALQNKTPEELAAARERLREEERKRSREAWIKACSKRFEKTVEETRQKIKEAEAACARAQAEVVKQIRARDGQERKLEQLEASRPQVLQRYSAEFDKLFELPHVTRVKAEGNIISVFTDRIYVQHEGETYDIGDFRIDIYADGSNGGVRMFNLTRKVDGYKTGMHAPHVFPDGTPCLGNLKEAIPQYIGEYEYSIVALLCIQYLQSVNVNDPAGKYIANWPKKQKEG